MNTRFPTASTTRAVLALLTTVVIAAGARSQPLDLPTAERLALADDPTVREIRARADSFRERSVSAAQLPDPKLKLGAAALPIDTFDLRQEPMTQLQLGFQQRFPPGDTLALRGAQLRSRADALENRGVDQVTATLRSVREDFLEVHYQLTAARIIEEAKEIFEELLVVTKDHYATGRTLQQDVFRAELELSRLNDRAIRIRNAEEMARARLAHWVNEVAWGQLDHTEPRLPEPKDLGTLLDSLGEHPRLLVVADQILAAELGIDAAREQYKPGWMIDLTYGDRTGQNVDGSARSDFLSAMVTVDLPLFRGKRQDRDLAASIRDLDAATAARDDAYRQLRRSAERESAALERLNERLALYRDHLLPEAAANSEASMAAYQSGVSDFTTLMRARITEYELQLEEARAATDRLVSRARLLYLSGEQR